MCVLLLAVNNNGEPSRRETQHWWQQLEHVVGQVMLELGWKDEYDFVHQMDRADYVKSSMDGEFSKNWAQGKQSSFRTKSHTGLAEQMSLGTDLETKVMKQSLQP